MKYTTELTVERAHCDLCEGEQYASNECASCNRDICMSHTEGFQFAYSYRSSNGTVDSSDRLHLCTHCLESPESKAKEILSKLKKHSRLTFELLELSGHYERYENLVPLNYKRQAIPKVKDEEEE